jgi:subtilisin-like proprotein convertase family protein
MKKPLILVVTFLLGAGLASAQITNTSSPALAIPDNTCSIPSFVSDTIAFTENGTITDVNIRVAITHTWRSDLQFYVDYSVGGGPVVLVQPGIGGSADNFYATFDDAAALPCSDPTNCGGAGTACVGPAPGVTCSGVQALSAFNTQTSPGTWTIYICDAAGADTGTLDQWAVTLDGPGLPVELMSFQVD